MILLVVGLLAFSNILCVSLNAQVSSGSLSGTVTDTASQAPIPEAQVRLINMATGVARTVATDNAGFYTAPDLLPGTYEMTVAAPAFTTQVRTGIAVNVGASLIFNVVMQAGDPARVVRLTVSGTPGDSPAVGGNVSASTVVNSPLNGRDWTQLATLQAGVTGVQTGSAQGGGNSERGFGAAMSISGARPDQNNFRVDGISINDYANGAPGSVLGDSLGIDAVEEVSVLGSNYPAEYGRTTGGIVNAATKSGTNSFHGSVYECFRNSALDARNFFDGATIPPFKRNQFGVSAGGPIRKDKTFIFGDYEGIRQAKGITNVNTVPSLDARAGILTYPGATADPTKFPSDCTATGVTDQCSVTVDASAQKYLGLYPSPTEAPDPSTPDIATFRFAGQQVINENFFTFRVDHKLSDRDNLFGTYLYDKTPYTSPDLFDNIQLESLTKRQFFVLEQTHIFSSNFTNSVRFGVNREYANNDQSVKAINPLSGNPTLGAVPGKDASLLVVGGGLTDLDGGLGSLSTWLFRWTSFQAYDDAFMPKGLHSLKFGFGFERMQL